LNSSNLQRYNFDDFEFLPREPEINRPPVITPVPSNGTRSQSDKLKRALAYLAEVPPAIEGQHGDQHTFTKVCSIVRGFDLAEAEALEALQDWNSRCDPPWPETDLIKKIHGAIRYGTEAIGGLLNVPLPRPRGVTNGRQEERSETSLQKQPEEEPEQKKDPDPDIHVWELHDLADVEQWKAEPLSWKIENLIPAGGIGFLSGAPKDGKSLLTCDQVVHMAHGAPWLDKFETTPSRVLYIAREDPARRLKERLTEINTSYGYGPIPRDRVRFLIRERLHLTEPQHIEWLYEQVRTHEFDFIVLDVLNRMIPELDEMNARDMARMVSVLEQLNRELNLTIQCLDHTRKPMNGKGSARDEQTPNPFDLKGSIAKYGAADFMLCVSRTRDAGRLQLYAENKDTDERPHFLIDVSPKGSDKPKFQYAGDVGQLANDMKATGDANREKVYRALSPTWESSGIIAKRTGLSGSTTRTHLNALYSDSPRRAERKGSTKTTEWRAFAETNEIHFSESEND
jgi:hypothetical protein